MSDGVGPIVHFEYCIDEAVQILNFGKIGHVREMKVSKHGIEYQVRWLTGNEQRMEWFDPRDLLRVRPK